MAPIGIPEWLVLGTIAASGILAMLHVMASAIDNEKRIREHRRECIRIRSAYLASTSRVRAAADDSPDSDVIILGG